VALKEYEMTKLKEQKAKGQFENFEALYHDMDKKKMPEEIRTHFQATKGKFLGRDKGKA